MPDSVKISELNQRTAVASDILPAVDSTFSQTVRVTASSIAAIGGGPPADNSVTTVKLADNSVTAPKCSFSGPDKLFSRSASGAGQGIEIDCTPYARGLLAAASGSAARDYLDALQSTENATFTGQTRFDRGTAGAPSLVTGNDLRTGAFFPDDGAIALSANGVEVFRVSDDGSLFMPVIGDATQRPRYTVAAWVVFNGAVIPGSVTDLVGSAAVVSARYGLTGSIIGDHAPTQQYLQTVEDSRGFQLDFPSTPTFNDSKGKGTFPRFNLGTETRANYTSPGDNYHWQWSGSGWTKVSANGHPWIGTIRLTTKAVSGSNPILGSGGISSVTRTGVGTYAISFTQPMPDSNYAWFALSSDDGIASAPAIGAAGQSTSGFGIAVRRASTGTTNYDPTRVHVLVIR